MALVAGDHTCDENSLPAALNLQGAVRRPSASEVKAITGFSIGGVSPVGLQHKLPMVIDRSLKRFETIYAAAGHTHCVFGVTYPELKRLTSAIISWRIAQPAAGEITLPGLPRSRTMAARTNPPEA